MFGFMKKRDDTVALNQKIGRYLNTLSVRSLDSERQRVETRARVATPCLMFLFSEAQAPKCYALGVTSDLSMRGVSLYTNEPIEPGQYVVVFGPVEHQIMVKATLKRCDATQFGTHNVGFEFNQLLRESDYPAIVRAIERLNSPQVPIESIPTPEVNSSLVNA